MPFCREYISRREKNFAQTLGISTLTILRDLEEIKKRCMSAEPVMEKQNGEWVETGEWKFDSRGAISAIAEQNKMLGNHAPTKISDPDGNPLKLQNNVLIVLPSNGRENSG
jgi:hypothetical protein